MTAGVALVRWVATGQSCPYCRRLDGKVVSVNSPFIGKGEAFEAEEEERAGKKKPPLVPGHDVKHPPAHRGCDCHLVSERSLQQGPMDSKLVIGTRISEFEVVIENPRQQIKGVSKHGERQMKTRGLNLEDAQGYIDTSVLAIEQERTKTVKYISEDGTSIVNRKDKLVTIYSKADFDKGERHLLARARGDNDE
ncbi:MAG: hypothetical protein C4589_08650 [Peptococcaceae bacterium]|nr:MAG: hypothetical protein C4589_08650 [Peptococcaceae bacterium]